MIAKAWRAGFEVEVILGDLGRKLFAENDPMDLASREYCRAVASELTQLTGYKWRAPERERPPPGFHVVPEYDLDPLDWPSCRRGGVELLTPPMPLEEAEMARRAIGDAIGQIDDDFNFYTHAHTMQCAWHINIDAGDHRLDAADFITGVDEIRILEGNQRLFSAYTGSQRHAVGAAILRHLALPDQVGVVASQLGNAVRHNAGASKGYAANFAKLERGYLELRHFSAATFFGDASLADLLRPILMALELWPNQGGPFEAAFLAKFQILRRWLDRFGDDIGWSLRPEICYPAGHLSFATQPLGWLSFVGSADIFITDGANDIAAIRGVPAADIREGVALLALDLAELQNRRLGRKTGNLAFNKAVTHLAAALRREPSAAPQHLTDLIVAAATERSKAPWSGSG